MRVMRFLCVPTVVVGAFLMIAGTALANPEAIKAPAVITASWCGPPAYTKAAWLAGWRQNPALARSAEVWVRANARYTHIKADQGFMSWVMGPNIKVITTPRGYVLTTNTSCPPGKGFSSYGGKLAHGGKAVVAWCNTSKTVKRQGNKVRTTYTETCTPLSKSYCRNLVTGRPFSRTWSVTKTIPEKTVPPVVPKPAPVPPGSCNVTINGTVTGNVIVCSEYIINVICGNLSQTYTGSNKDEVVDNATKWQQANCVTPSPPLPTPTCPPGTTGTWPFCVLPLPPPPVNQPPALTIPNQHSEFTLYTREICGTVRDTEDQSSLNVWFTADRGDVLPGTTRKVDAVTWCFMYRAPWSPGFDRITVHALDGHNPERTVISNSFEIRTAP